MEQTKIAIILRGVPGAGKSTFTKMLKEMSPRIAIHAIDDLHKDSEDNFVWNEPKAKAFYMLNLANFVRSCSEGRPIVVCDCINIRISDFEPYLEAAREFGYNVYVVTPDMPPAIIAEVRNSHGVSKHQIEEMKKNWEHWPIKGAKNECS